MRVGPAPNRATSRTRPPRRSRRPIRPMRKTRNRSKPRVNHRSCVTATTVPSKRFEAVLERLGAREVEVVGRLVEEEQGRAAELEQQDLEARLLAARQGVEVLLGRLGELVAVQDARRLLPRQAAAALVATVQDVEQRPAGEVRTHVRLREPAGSDPAPSRADPACRTGGSPPRRRAGARCRGRCRRGQAGAAGGTCRIRSHRARPAARRTTPRRRTASSGPSARATRRRPPASPCGHRRAACGRSAPWAPRWAVPPPRTCAGGSAPPGTARPCRR